MNYKGVVEGGRGTIFFKEMHTIVGKEDQDEGLAFMQLHLGGVATASDYITRVRSE